jgi:hypothetical protein
VWFQVFYAVKGRDGNPGPPSFQTRLTPLISRGVCSIQKLSFRSVVGPRHLFQTTLTTDEKSTLTCYTVIYGMPFSLLQSALKIFRNDDCTVAEPGFRPRGHENFVGVPR